MARVQRAFVQVRYEKSWFLSCVNYVSTCGALFRKWQKIWPYYDSLWNANANGTTVFPSEYGYPVWRVKTTCEMVKKFRREVFTLFVLTWTWQTDGQTDTAWWHRPRLCIASRVKIIRRKFWSTFILHFFNTIPSAVIFNRFVFTSVFKHRVFRSSTTFLLRLDRPEKFLHWNFGLTSPKVQRQSWIQHGRLCYKSTKSTV